MSIAAWKAAQKDLTDAQDYLDLIGKTTTRSTVASREGEAATAGHLSSFSITTQINFQPYDGATNYHSCKKFDDALSIVARRRWSELKDEALAYLREVETERAVSAEAEVKAMLQSIRAR